MKSVTEQNGIWPSATVYNHKMDWWGRQKVFINRVPNLGELGAPLPQAILFCKTQKYLLPKRLKSKSMPREPRPPSPALSIYNPRLLHRWVSVYPSLGSLECTLVRPVSLLLQCSQLCKGLWLLCPGSRAACILGARETFLAFTPVCCSQGERVGAVQDLCCVA